MRYAQYLKSEAYISAADSDALLERWRYGRRLLCDNTVIAKSGKSLRHGVLDQLIAKSKAKGYRLTEQEIQRRLRAARAYPTQTQIRNACADFANWDELARAGFPPVDRPEGEPDYDPIAERERAARGRGRRLLPERNEEAALFPGDRFGDLSGLEELTKYAEEMAEITARFVRRDDERSAYLRSLVKAVGGDMNATWARAREALGGPGGGA